VSIDISPTFLLDAATGSLVEAELWDAITERQLLDWEREWTPALKANLALLRAAGIERGRLPQSSHWNWRRKIEHFGNLLANPGYSVMCQGMTQGMMILDTTRSARLASQRLLPIVYVEYLETAPWNQFLQNQRPRYQGVGSVLMRAAIAQSRMDGFKGRVGLHSLPQSIDYYVKHCGMTDLGGDATYQNLRYLEMTPEQADAFSPERSER
jgi:hypothetical protein